MKKGKNIFNLPPPKVSTITPQEQMDLDRYFIKLTSFKRLIKFGIHNFDEQGQILAQENITTLPEKMSGSMFIEELITYFEQEDQPHTYRKCAKLKKLLDEHRKKFK